MGAFQHPGAARLHMRIRPGLYAKQLLLEPRRVQRRAIQRHERPVRPARAGVDHARRNFLTRAGRAVDQHARPGRCHTLNARAQAVDGWARARELTLEARTHAQLGIFPRQP